MLSNSILEVNNLAFSWPRQKTWLFGPLNLSFETGSITSLLGTNGSGKTSFLNVIGGRLPPSAGKVLVKGRSANADDFNYMLQDSSRLLFSHLTLGQNLNLSKNPAHDKERSMENTKKLLFPDENILGKYPAHCSGGQKQRTVLYRAISDIAYFPVTLLDEPFAQISQDVKNQVYQDLRKAVRNSSVAAIIVTHDISEAIILGDHVIIISNQAPHIFDTSSVEDAQAFIGAAEIRDTIQTALFYANNSQSIVNPKGTNT